MRQPEMKTLQRIHNDPFDGFPTADTPPKKGMPLVLALIALAIIAIATWYRPGPPVAPLGICAETSTAEERFARAREYRNQADRLREQGLRGWDDAAILREALANYLTAWKLLTGRDWRSTATWYGAHDYAENDSARPSVSNSDADLLLTVLRDRIIDMEDATDACGLW